MKFKTEDTNIAKDFAKQAEKFVKGLYTPLSGGLLIEAIKKRRTQRECPKQY